MRKPLVVAGVVSLAVLAVATAGTYIYFFSGLRTAPAQLGLSASPAVSSSPASSGGLAGKWTVTTGSLAGYRVKELFVGQSSKHEAVARTSTVSGGLTASGDSSGYQVSSFTLTVGLADLHSVDSVAGRDVTQRDGVVMRQLGIQQFPTATFTAVTASVPGIVSSQQVDVTATGKLTIHGVTKDITVKAKAQHVGDRIEIAGSVSINMADYQVSPPQVAFVTVDPAMTIEFDVFLTKAA